MDKKERIVNAAMSIFEQKGYEEAKISDITNAAGIAQGTFYLYFPSKLALIPNIAEKMVVKLLETIGKELAFYEDIEDELRQIIEVVFRFVDEYKVIYAFIYTGLSQSVHLKEWEAIYAPFYEWMSVFIKERKESKIIRAKIPSKQLAKFIITAIEATAEQTYLYGMVKYANVEKQKSFLLEFLLNGLRVKK